MSSFQNAISPHQRFVSQRKIENEKRKTKTQKQFHRILEDEERNKKKQRTEPEKSFYNRVFESESNDLASEETTPTPQIEETPKTLLKKSITKDRFFKERLQWEEEKQAREQLFEEKQQRREQLIQNFRKRKQIKQKLTRKTKKGQPVLDNLVQHYLKKLQNS